jgi:hypothetical protein
MRNYTKVSFKIYTSNKILFLVNLIMRRKEHVASVGLERGSYRFWWERLRERDHVKDEGIDVRTIIQSIFKKQNRAMDWIDPAKDRDRWRVF